MLNLFVIGDWGRGGTAQQHAVARAMARVARRLPPTAIVSTGDNFYEFGIESVDDPLLHASFEAVYGDPALAVPWYPVLGNHDHAGSIEAQIAYGERNPAWNLPARYHALELPAPGGSLQLAFLDTTALLPEYHLGGLLALPGVIGTRPGDQLAWLDATLASSDARWRIVVGHHPIFSGSPFHGSSPVLKEALLPRLERHGTDLYLCGHEHDLQYLVGGGVHHLLSGGGAEARPTGALPETRFARAAPGFAVLSVTRDALAPRFFDERGELLYQDTIAPAQRARGGPARSLSAGSRR